MGLKYALSQPLFLGAPTYKLLLRFDGGNNSDVVTDSGANGYTINWGTNDPANQHAQSTAEVLFGVSSFWSFRGGGTPGHGGRSSACDWNAGTGMDFGSSPDFVIGGAIFPTFDTGSAGDAECILMLRRNVGDWWKLSYDDAGAVYYQSHQGGTTFTNQVTSTVFFQYNEWNWFFVSSHAQDTSIWVGTDASGFVTNDSSGFDSSPYDFGTLGATSGTVSNDPIASNGTMNCYMDHLYVATGTYINPFWNASGQMPVPTSQP